MLPVRVTNDGVRWSSGLDIDDAAVVWPGNRSTVPLDYSAEDAPAELTIALILPTSQLPVYSHFVGHAVSAINNGTQLLPFTKLRLQAYAEEPIISSSEATRAAAAAVMLDTMIADAEATGAPLVGYARHMRVLAAPVVAALRT